MYTGISEESVLKIMIPIIYSDHHSELSPLKTNLSINVTLFYQSTFHSPDRLALFHALKVIYHALGESQSQNTEYPHFITDLMRLRVFRFNKRRRLCAYALDESLWEYYRSWRGIDSFESRFQVLQLGPDPCILRLKAKLLHPILSSYVSPQFLGR